MHPEEKLRSMGLELQMPTPPTARYVPAVKVGNLLFVSGHGPVRDGKVQFIGKVGREWTIEQGYEASRLTMVNLLASVKLVLGDLAKVKRTVKLLGMVNCTEDFTRTPQVINGASDLLGELYGDMGQHARSAVGLQQLPNGMAVEIEAIFEVED
ncbi:MAG TPA: RidA family protein [Chloroflexota bacterium]|nr:RidA family protein [Chloroflexota bacterium]